jgi:pimeloyl-[acyl-carrier protein] synthase
MGPVETEGDAMAIDTGAAVSEYIQTLSLQMLTCADYEIAQDPYHNLYEPLRDANPVLWSEGLSAWVVTGLAEATFILKDDRVTSGNFQRMMTTGLSDEDAEEVLKAPRIQFGTRMMVGLEEPDHTRVRRAIQSAFAPRKIEEMRPFARRAIDSLLDDVEGSEFDFYSRVAQALPSVVICEMLGIPKEDRERFLSWVNVFVATAPPRGDDDPSAAYARQDAMWSDCEEYFRGFVDDSRGRDTLFGRIVRAFDAETLTWPELVANSVFLVGAGHETTASLLTNGFVALLRNREQFELMQAKTELIPNAVEEFLRYDAPFQMSSRFTRGSFELAGEDLEPGQPILVSLGGANRDPRAYDDPHSLDIERSNVTHLSFANGIHYCLGAALARLEVQEGFAALAERFPHVEIVEDPVFRNNPVFRTVHELLLRA